MTMLPKFLLLWTDAVLWLMTAVLVWYGWRIRVNPNLRASWLKVARDPAALCAGIVLAMFALVTLADSVHFRRALAPAAGASAATPRFYSANVESVLDALLARQIEMRETDYSRPLAYLGYSKEAMERDGQPVRDYPRLQFGGAHLQDPASQWLPDIGRRAAAGAAMGAMLAIVAVLVSAATLRAEH